jgi:hypothetical protein
LNIMEEIWKDVIGFEGMYFISNYGRVGSKRQGKFKIMKTRPDSNGYPQAIFCVDRKLISKRVSRLVALHFIELIDNKNDVNHIDGNKMNNYYTNLEWVNKRENSVHRNILNPLMKKSSNYVGVYLSKSSGKYVSEIRLEKRKIYIGTFDCEIKAHEAYLKKCSELNIINKYINHKTQVAS